MDSMKIIFLAIVVIVYLQTPAVSATGDVVNWAGYGEERLSTVVISGKLLCHPAIDHHKLDTTPIPVSGASVAVFCGTTGRKKKSWAKGSTGSYGEFLIDLPSDLHAIPNLEKVCHVKVFSLPKSCHCHHGFTGKRKAIKLTYMGEGVRSYTTDNIDLVTKPESKSETGRQSNV